jgi:hypothetical protein
MNKKKDPGVVVSIVLKIIEALNAFRWIVPTPEQKREREMRRIRRKFMQRKITKEMYLQIMDDLRPSNVPGEEG